MVELVDDTRAVSARGEDKVRAVLIGRQISDEVILRCSDRPLGRVSAVLIGRDELVLN